MLIEQVVLIGLGSRKEALPMTPTTSLLSMIEQTKKKVTRDLLGGNRLLSLIGVSMPRSGNWLRISMGLRLVRESDNH